MTIAFSALFLACWIAWCRRGKVASADDRSTSKVRLESSPGGLGLVLVATCLTGLSLQGAGAAAYVQGGWSIALAVQTFGPLLSITGLFLLLRRFAAQSPTLGAVTPAAIFFARDGRNFTAALVIDGILAASGIVAAAVQLQLLLAVAEFAVPEFAAWGAIALLLAMGIPVAWCGTEGVIRAQVLQAAVMTACLVAAAVAAVVVVPETWKIATGNSAGNVAADRFGLNAALWPALWAGAVVFHPMMWLRVGVAADRSSARAAAWWLSLAASTKSAAVILGFAAYAAMPPHADSLGLMRPHAFVEAAGDDASPVLFAQAVEMGDRRSNFVGRIAGSLLSSTMFVVAAGNAIACLQSVVALLAADRRSGVLQLRAVAHVRSNDKYAGRVAMLVLLAAACAVCRMDRGYEPRRQLVALIHEGAVLLPFVLGQFLPMVVDGAFFGRLRGRPIIAGLAIGSAITLLLSEPVRVVLALRFPQVLERISALYQPQVGLAVSLSLNTALAVAGTLFAAAWRPAAGDARLSDDLSQGAHR